MSLASAPAFNPLLTHLGALQIPTSLLERRKGFSSLFQWAELIVLFEQPFQSIGQYLFGLLYVDTHMIGLIPGDLLGLPGRFLQSLACRGRHQDVMRAVLEIDWPG